MKQNVGIGLYKTVTQFSGLPVGMPAVGIEQELSFPRIFPKNLSDYKCVANSNYTE